MNRRKIIVTFYAGTHEIKGNVMLTFPVNQYGKELLCLTFLIPYTLGNLSAANNRF